MALEYIHYKGFLYRGTPKYESVSIPSLLLLLLRQLRQLCVAAVRKIAAVVALQRCWWRQALVACVCASCGSIAVHYSSYETGV